ASQHPDIEVLTRLVEIEKRLARLRNRALLGADEVATEIVNQINDEFARLHPGVGEYSLDNVRYAYKRADGTLGITFHSVFEFEEGMPREFTAGYELKGGEETPEISFRETPRR
ncbi:MAG: hypothetical protein AAF456_19760, partial [Planctomycetota bacterium]